MPTSPYISYDQCLVKERKALILLVKEIFGVAKHEGENQELARQLEQIPLNCMV